MKPITTYLSAIALFACSLLLFSCNMEDFDMSKLAKPDDIIPVIYAPLANGTYKVSKLTTSLPGVPVPSEGFTLDPVVISKTGTTFRSLAIDSIYLVTYFTNNSLCDMEFELSFIGSPNKTKLNTFKSDKIPAGKKEFRVQFNLGPNEQANLQKAYDIELKFILIPPPGVTVKFADLINSDFTVMIYFYAPANIFKLASTEFY